MDKRSITSKMNGALGGRPKKYEELYYLEGEIWKIIEEFSDYMVSSKGRIISLREKGKLMIPQSGKRGYRCIVFSVNNKKYNKKISRLVAEAFIENQGNKPIVDHINGDKEDNSVENLRWATPTENNTGFRKTSNNGGSYYRGVNWDNARNKWRARITMDRKEHNIGRFDCEHEAAEAYNQKAIELGFLPEALNIVKFFDKM